MSTSIIIRPYGPSMGADVLGIDLSQGISTEEFGLVQKALHEYQVLFFRDQQEIPPETQLEIGRKFGKLHIHPAAPTMKNFPEIFVIHTHRNSNISNGELWHSDVSCDAEPPLGTMLQLHILPSIGGDTLFANMYQAYETLSKPLQEFILELKALHESEHVFRGRYSDRGVKEEPRDFPANLHPVVRTHPETGRKALFVNRTFTTRIVDLYEEESLSTLEMLFRHIEDVSLQTRFRWRKNDLVFWDNRCVQHRALWDYWPEERKGRRVTIAGDRPF